VEGKRGKDVSAKEEGGRPLVLNYMDGGGGGWVHRVGRNETAGKHVPRSCWWDAGGGGGGEEGLDEAGGGVVRRGGEGGGGGVHAMVVVVGVRVGAALVVVVMAGGEDRGRLLKPLTHGPTTAAVSAAAGAAARGRDVDGVRGSVLLERCPAAALLLQGGVVGKEVARDLAQLAGRQEARDIMRPQVLEDGPQLLVGGPALDAGLVDLIAVVVVGKAPAVKQGAAYPVVPEGDLLARRHGGRGEGGPFWGRRSRGPGGEFWPCVCGVCVW